MIAASALAMPRLRPPLPAERRFALAAFCLSLLVHGLAALLLPGFGQAPLPQTPPPLVVTLLDPPAPIAPTAPDPGPVKAMAPPSPLTPAAPIPIRPAPAQMPGLRSVTAPRTPPGPVAAAHRTAPSAPANSSTTLPIQETPTATSTAGTSLPAPTAPPPPAPVVAGPDPSLLAGYRNALANLLAREQTYPRIAAVRGWEGEVVLRVVIARKGQLVNARVLRSSGYAVLDEHALALVADVQPFPALPADLPGDDLAVTVPVHYQLKVRG
ncbi:MAG: energy transducer TonB [Zoogloeaceae bacterium]|nr:energy transducer TonB [Zoogloeaceae bacterium]